MLMQFQEVHQADGYLEAHRNVEDPPKRLGGSLSFAVEQSSGGDFRPAGPARA